MRASSTYVARVFGLLLIVLVGAWDVDAMRPHIVAHSWYTLALVLLFFAAHLGDYFTVGRLIHRFDPTTFAKPAAPALFLVQNAAPGSIPNRVASPEPFSFRHAMHAGWEKLFAYQQPPSLVPRTATARLYAFTISRAETAQAAGGPAVTQPQYSVVPVE